MWWYGRRRTYLIGAITSAVFAVPFFLLMDTGSAAIIAIAVVIGMIFHDLMYGTPAAFMTEMFEAEHRHTGASLGSQIASVVAGGFSPVIALLLVGLADNQPRLVAVFIVGLSLITITAVILAPRNPPRKQGRKRGWLDRAGVRTSAQRRRTCEWVAAAVALHSQSVLSQQPQERRGMS